MTEEQQVNKVKAQFAREGSELVVHPVSHGGYFAPYIARALCDLYKVGWLY